MVILSSLLYIYDLHIHHAPKTKCFLLKCMRKLEFNLSANDISLEEAVEDYSHTIVFYRTRSGYTLFIQTMVVNNFKYLLQLNCLILEALKSE